MIGEHGRPVLGDALPSGDAIRRADAAIARAAKGLCPECEAPLNEDGGCDACRRAEGGE